MFLRRYRRTCPLWHPRVVTDISAFCPGSLVLDGPGGMSVVAVTPDYFPDVEPITIPRRERLASNSPVKYLYTMRVFPASDFLSDLLTFGGLACFGFLPRTKGSLLEAIP